MAWRTVLQQAWLRRGGLACALWPLSVVYSLLRAIASRRHAALATDDLPGKVPVVIVGNVVAGGAGKTPTVIAVVAHLVRAGWRPVVISRGYGRQGSAVADVMPDSDPAECGDEPLLIRRRSAVPVFVGRQRVQAALAALQAHPLTNVVVSDDGLQHHALPRDIEIVVFDDRGIGNGWLLPAGPLREPWPRPCDIILHTGSTPAFEGFHARRSLAAFAHDARGGTRILAEFRGTPVHALAGIAQPGAFFGMLEAQGLQLERCIALPDHAAVTARDLPPDDGIPLICTEKDAVKLWRLRPHAWAVPLDFEPPTDFFDRLDELLSRHGQQAH